VAVIGMLVGLSGLRGRRDLAADELTAVAVVASPDGRAVTGAVPGHEFAKGGPSA
jgi:hypothetical protein